MRPLSTIELLEVWERGLAAPPVERMLALLQVANPDQSADDLARLTIGQRDGQLLTLREWTFGDRLVSVATCPRCGARLELDFAVGDIRAEPPGSDAELVLLAAGYTVAFRLPTSRDLAPLATATDLALARRALLARCVLDAREGDEPRPADQLPETVANALARRMAEADPQADVQLALTCPTCGHAWHEAFDIVSFFWSEIDAWAARTLRDVHVLASRYGWSEADILTISAWRRQTYLDLISGN
jgi:hypothetical protein